MLSNFTIKSWNTGNHRIIGSKGVFSLDIPVVEDLPPLSEQHKSEMEQIVQENNAKNQDWGFKDPRSCITYPLWIPALGAHKVILVYRHPYYVVNHYSRRVNIMQRWSRAKRAYDVWTENNDSCVLKYFLLNRLSS